MFICHFQTSTLLCRLTVVGRRANWLAYPRQQHKLGGAAQPCRDFPQLLIPRATQIKDMSAALAASAASVGTIFLPTASTDRSLLPASRHFPSYLSCCRTRPQRSQDSRETGHRPVSWLGITLSHGSRYSRTAGRPVTKKQINSTLVAGLDRTLTLTTTRLPRPRTQS